MHVRDALLLAWAGVSELELLPPLPLSDVACVEQRRPETKDPGW